MPASVPEVPSGVPIGAQELPPGAAAVGQGEQGNGNGGLQAMGQGKPRGPLLCQKQAHLTQCGSGSCGTGDEDRQNGLEPGPEPIGQRLCRLEDQAYAVQQGNGRNGNAGSAQA